MVPDTDEVGSLLDQFRESRRAFESRLRAVPFELHDRIPPGEAWGLRDLVAHAAAWLEEANDRIPRLLAGAPSLAYDVDAFNAAAVERAADWTAQQALGAFRRAADRYDVIVSESDPADLAESDEVMRWLRSVGSALMNEHFGEIERIAARLAADGQRPGAGS